MVRVVLLTSGLVSLMLGILLSVPSAAAQEPPTVRTLVNQRVELLPQEPVCWDAFRMALPSGDSRPSAGYHPGPLALFYHVEGAHRVEYAGGPTRTAGPREGLLVGNNNWHAHTNPGTAALTAIVFELTCQAPGVGGRPQHGGLRGLTFPLGNAGPLPGIRPRVPYQVQLLEVAGPPGSGTPTTSAPGPVTSYILEGTVAVSTAAGVKQYGPGELLVIPPDTPFQTATVGNAPARALVVLLTPAGEPASLLRPEVRLPGAAPAALPRTGDASPWAGPLGLLVGAILLAAGMGLRRAQA